MIDIKIIRENPSEIKKMISNQEQYISLSTRKRDGSFVDTPVWFAQEGETNNYYTVDDSPKGPVIYRYKVTINLEEIDSQNTQIRVSASGESEQDGAILKTGGIHEPDFFKKFFASMEKSLFLDENVAP